MKNLLLCCILIFSAFYVETSELVLFSIGNAKVFVFDIFYFSCLSYFFAKTFISNSPKQRHDNVVFYALLGIVLAGIANSCFSLLRDGASSFGERARSEYYIVFPALFIFSAFRSRVTIESLLNWLHATGIIVAVVIVVKTILFSMGLLEAEDEWVRFGANNGTIMVVFSLMFLTTKFITSRKIDFFQGLLFVFLLLSLILSQFRTMWVAFAISAFVIYILNLKSYRSLLGLLISAIVIIVLFEVLQTYILPRGMTENLQRSSKLLEGFENDPDWIWRLVQWDQYYTTSMESPFFGHGIGAALPVFVVDKVYDNIPAHNAWLMYFFNQGLAGVLVNLFAHGAVFATQFRLLKKCVRGSIDHFFILLFIGMHSIVFLYTITYTDSIYMWMFAGLTASLVNIFWDDKKNNEHLSLSTELQQ